MDLSSWRDIILIIWGLVTTVCIVFLTVIFFLFYRKTIALIESTDLVVARVGAIVEYAEMEIVRPVKQVGDMIQGIIQGVSVISNLFKKKEDQDE
ncbi:MAG: hypothetical protein ACYDHZ_05065 [Dehalococcoidia bacterium]